MESAFHNYGTWRYNFTATIDAKSLMEAAASATAADIALLNSAIEFENAGVKAYKDAAALNLLSPAVLDVAKGFMADHEAHAAALTSVVTSAGATATTATAKLEYPALKSEADIVAFAETVERGAATAYLTDIGQLSNAKLAKLLASILGVETTHVSTLASVLKHGPAYVGFVNRRAPSEAAARFR
jgi:rubrerythrin